MNTKILNDIFLKPVNITQNLLRLSETVIDYANNQQQTEDTFGEKWEKTSKIKEVDKLYSFQYDWFLKLYGFDSVKHLKSFLSDKKIIFDAGCGLGYKTAWFAQLAPESLVIGMDISDSVEIAAKNFQHLNNLFFIQGDISNTLIKPETFDFVVCDQVIMHTEDPELTFQHLTNITKIGGQFCCYVYSKKSLPRELIDDYFRKATHTISKDAMWEFAAQLTELGKRLSELKVEIESPEIPLLGIKEGKYDIQRFIYWNFLKCFWREDWGFDLCKVTNYDWYAPSNAKRYSKEEFVKLINSNNLKIEYLHEEEACHSGRFSRK